MHCWGSTFTETKAVSWLSPIVNPRPNEAHKAVPSTILFICWSVFDINITTHFHYHLKLALSKTAISEKYDVILPEFNTQNKGHQYFL